MNALGDRIDALGDDQALEALNLLAGFALGAKPDDEVLADTARTAGRNPHELELELKAAQPAQAADFARLVLLAHALTVDRGEVEDAIQAAGQKAFLLEVAVIGLLGLAIAHLALTRGRQSESRTVRVDVEPDGRVAIEVQEELKNYNVGDVLAPLLGSVLGRDE